MRRRANGPVLSVLALLASAGLLAGSFYFAREFANRDEDPPSVGIFADDASDRLQVVLGDPDADWQHLDISSDEPVRFSLNGDPASGPFTPPGDAIPVATEPYPVWGGQHLQLCAVGGPRTTPVTITSHGDVVFSQVLHLNACSTP